MVYDVKCRESFNNVRDWLDSINEHASPSVAKILVANKCDLPHVVSRAEGEVCRCGNR